jgi:hypothetical protein
MFLPPASDVREAVDCMMVHPPCLAQRLSRAHHVRVRAWSPSSCRWGDGVIVPASEVSPWQILDHGAHKQMIDDGVHWQISTSIGFHRRCSTTSSAPPTSFAEPPSRAPIIGWLVGISPTMLSPTCRPLLPVAFHHTTISSRARAGRSLKELPAGDSHRRLYAAVRFSDVCRQELSRAGDW